MLVLLAHYFVTMTRYLSTNQWSAYKRVPTEGQTVAVICHNGTFHWLSWEAHGIQVTICVLQLYANFDWLKHFPKRGSRVRGQNRAIWLAAEMGRPFPKSYCSQCPLRGNWWRHSSRPINDQLTSRFWLLSFLRDVKIQTKNDGFHHFYPKYFHSCVID